MYLDNREDQATDQAALDDLYSMILGLMNDNSIRLVDNTGFLSWATEETLPNLRDSTRMVILSDDGAEFITDVEALQSSLDAILNEQYDRQLRFQILALPAPG